MKTFYIETFGCQMNVHDSEKVVGTLLEQGYEKVETPEQAGLVLYNTCSIRDKAEQKVFHRLQQFKREHRVEYNRLVATGALEKYLVDAPTEPMTLGSRILGFTLIGCGLLLLVFVLIGMFAGGNGA